jgi:hypothetical protein
MAYGERNGTGNTHMLLPIEIKLPTYRKQEDKSINPGYRDANSHFVSSSQDSLT